MILYIYIYDRVIWRILKNENVSKCQVYYLVFLSMPVYYY